MLVSLQGSAAPALLSVDWKLIPSLPGFTWRELLLLRTCRKEHGQEEESMFYKRQRMQPGIGSFILATVLAGAAAALAPQPDQDTARIAIPGVIGALEVKVGPTSWVSDLTEDGREVQLIAMGRADHLLITAFLQRVEFPASAERCRKEWWPKTKKVKMKREDLQESAVKNGIALVESMVPQYKGEKLHMKDVHAYLGSGDLCAEIHLSKVEFKPDDQQLFETVLSTIRLLPDEPVLKEPNSVLYIFTASRSFVHRDYAAATTSSKKPWIWKRSIEVSRETCFAC
jgi:hypothetical protein